MNLNNSGFKILSENIQENSKMTGMNLNEAGFIIWGVPHPPFTDKMFGKKGVTDIFLLGKKSYGFGGYPLLRTRRRSYGFGGYPTPPLRTKSAK